MTRSMSSTSTDTVAYRVTATNYDGTAATISGDVVQLAWIPTTQAKPAAGDWHTASWVAANIAGLLVGPANSGVVLAPGHYAAWARIVDNPEVPEIPCGQLIIF